MKTIKIIAELRYDDKLMHGKTKEGIDWFYNDILKCRKKNYLVLHSNEIGDEIGTVKILTIKSL
jgi:hypothetical protein